MGNRANPDSDPLTPGRSSTIFVFGARPEDGLWLSLKAFAGTQFVLDPAASLTKADLAVGIRDDVNERALHAFTRSAFDAGVPALCVQLRQIDVLIGPLTLPGRPGCGNCALERLRAASATADPRSRESRTPHQLAWAAGSAVVREARAIIGNGPEQSQLLDHVLAIDSETLGESLHKVIPLPECTTCGGAAAFPPVRQEALRLTPEDSPEVVLGALAGWVDLLTGVISNLYLEPAGDLGVALPIIATAAPTHIVERDGSLRRLALGWGKGLTVSGAVLSAVGEAIERYSASLPDARRIIWERPDDLDGEVLDPGAFAFYSDAQYERDGFPYVRFDRGIPHPWIRGTWLGTADPVWVPALFAFLSFTLWPEQLICQGTSNGLAASTEFDDAGLRATLELVERDAFMAAWLTASPGCRVELDESLDPLLRSVLEGIEAFEAKVEVYLLGTSVCGTTVLCLGLGDGYQYPGATIGLASDLDPCAAVRQAILELGQTGPYLRRMMREHALPVPGDPGSVQEMLHHASYYFPAERAAAFNWLRNGDSAIALRDLAECGQRGLVNCAAELDAAGVRVALVDVTSADVATGPFRVVRAVSPDLQSISFGYGLDRKPVERVRRLKLAPDVPPIHPIW
jgi:ribosomal protein S12 methylthiotransferase accessory factor